MDSDTTTLHDAVTVLRQHFGEQLAGPSDRTEAQMRHALQQQLGLDLRAANVLLDKLRAGGQIAYVADAKAHEYTGDTSTGPVISVPNMETSGGGPLITTASPGMVLDAVNDEGDDVEQGLEEATVPADDGEPEEEEGDGTHGYWRIG